MAAMAKIHDPPSSIRESEMNATDIRLAELQARRPGMSLDRKFYCDPEFYRLDLETIFYRDWLFAGHDCEIPAPGDYFTIQIGDYPVMVLRGRDGSIRALHNTCRHRGSRICSAARGAVKRLVCPYHQWTYDLDGALIRARQQDGRIDKAEAGLKPVRCESAGGYIFVCVAPVAPIFEPFRAQLEKYVSPHKLARRQNRLREHHRRERQLEAGVGEQPRVLSLRGEPSRALPDLPRAPDRLGN